MSNEKSAVALDINGLAVFKENIVKKYIKQSEAPSVIGRAVYNAMQQYRKDVVRFYASYSSLPNVGNPGTLYFIHKSVDKEHDDLNAKYEGQIWFDAPGTHNYLWCEYNATTKVKVYRSNIHGYYVLNLADIDKDNFSYCSIYTPNYTSSYGLFLPNTEIRVTTYDQLASLSGKLIGIQAGTYSGSNTITYNGAVEIPRYTYAGELPDQYKVPDDEIWVLSDNDTLRIKINGYNNDYITITKRNKYGYFVLRKNVHIPNSTTSSSANVYLYLDGYGNFYKVDRENSTPIKITSISHFDSLYGHIVTKSKLDKVVMLYVVYPYDSGRIVFRQTGSITVPDDEIWIDSTNWPAMYCSLTGNNGPYTEVEMNEYGYYVLTKAMLDNANPFTSITLAVQSSNNKIDWYYTPGLTGYSYTGLNVGRLCDGTISSPTKITSLEDAYVLLGKIISVAGSETVSIKSEVLPPTVIPDSEVWIRPDDWDNVAELYLHRYDGNYGYATIQTLYKNSYGYYVLEPDAIANQSYWFGTFISKSNANKRPSDDGQTSMYLWLGPGYGYNNYNTKPTFNWCKGKIVTILPRNTMMVPVALPPYETEYVNDIISPAPQDMSDNKFVIYTWANGRYRQLSSSIFNISDIKLDDFVDQVASLTSNKAISNKAFCDVLRYKYSIANILATPAAGYDNLVASKGIKEAIDKLITWDDIECIPITENEIHDVFTTYAPISLEAAKHYRIVIRGIKSEGANYLAKIFDVETLAGLTFAERSPDGPSMSETLIFIEDDTGKRIPVTVSCANKYNSPTMFYPGDLFDQNTDGYYRADTSNDDLVITIDIDRKLAMSTLRKLTFQCLAGRPYQTTVPPTEKLYISTYGSIGGVDYPHFRKDVIYTPNRVANDGIYTILLFPTE